MAPYNFFLISQLKFQFVWELIEAIQKNTPDTLKAIPEIQYNNYIFLFRMWIHLCQSLASCVDFVSEIFCVHNEYGIFFNKCIFTE